MVNKSHTCSTSVADGTATGSSCKSPRVRDRIFATARELFYRYGIRGVGVDTIACEAGTNKMSFYRAFQSKDELVAECVRESEREYFAWWDEVIAPYAGDPRRQIEALFDAYANKVCKKQSRGCAIANAAVELPEEDHPARLIVAEHKAEVRRRFRALAREIGVREPNVLGDALMLLMEGAQLTRLTFPLHDGPAQAVTEAARQLIDAYLPTEKARKAPRIAAAH